MDKDWASVQLCKWQLWHCTQRVGLASPNFQELMLTLYLQVFQQS